MNAHDKVVKTLAELFGDRILAAEFANSPNQFLEARLQGADLTKVDLRVAVEQAAVSAELDPQYAAAITESMYTPAQYIRINTEPMDLDDDGYSSKTATDASMERDGQAIEIDRPNIETRDDDRFDSPTPEEIRERLNQLERAIEREADNAPPVQYVSDDNGGMRVNPREDYDPDCYKPDTYVPEVDTDMKCVEYVTSNCVTTCYPDDPEVADKLCDTRDYTDPFPREDPRDVCPTTDGGRPYPDDCTEPYADEKEPEVDEKKPDEDGKKPEVDEQEPYADEDPGGEEMKYDGDGPNPDEDNDGRDPDDPRHQEKYEADEARRKAAAEKADEEARQAKQEQQDEAAKAEQEKEAEAAKQDEIDDASEDDSFGRHLDSPGKREYIESNAEEVAKTDNGAKDVDYGKGAKVQEMIEDKVEYAKSNSGVDGIDEALEGQRSEMSSDAIAAAVEAPSDPINEMPIDNDDAPPVELDEPAEDMPMDDATAEEAMSE